MMALCRKLADTLPHPIIRKQTTRLHSPGCWLDTESSLQPASGQDRVKIHFSDLTPSAASKSCPQKILDGTTQMTCCNQGPKHKFLHRPRPTPNLSGREKTAASEITPKKWTRI